ncbi:hypothetical protein DNHGIG_21000 [Collibacillus ludicampi]|uniref:Uncharacterized protein n=1 Tax=Collibacillus ludicampi TaxID=2771369 RepID=A0AAV4LFF3_9BACL|nr:hypothetical protein DNHGIG_21000 [Collibacillus ludicampi]
MGMNNLHLFVVDKRGCKVHECYSPKMGGDIMYFAAVFLFPFHDNGGRTDEMGDVLRSEQRKGGLDC